jgi:hypothetical protein
MEAQPNQKVIEFSDSTIIILSMNVGSVGKLYHTNKKQNSGHKM